MSDLKFYNASPHQIIHPQDRWIPSDDLLKESSYEQLLPPLVHKLRQAVYNWRSKDYQEASFTSKALLKWWFKEKHFLGDEHKEFCYYFAQREAIETIIYLYDVKKIKNHYELLQFDSSQSVSLKMFQENWRRFVIKMATGSGKTKVMSLIIAWSYFHKLYEPSSPLACNFLLIAPNIIVLDRLKTDFQGFDIFHQDPVIPQNGYEGKNWKNDFQLTLYIQDEMGNTQSTKNVFLTNIHRVYSNSRLSSQNILSGKDDHFLGLQPVTKTLDSQVNLKDIVKDINELVVINDEAHHIHDEGLAWFQSIQDIHNQLKQKGKFLSLQVDLTATPKHNNGCIFVQTISDYPLVEAIAQKIVKQPVLPDAKSRNKLREKETSKYVEKYKDYLSLGVKEWKKSYQENIKLNKKSILFIMTDDTSNCDEVAKYLENTYPELKRSVLSIHTNRSGDISESLTSQKKRELDQLREQANTIDSLGNPYKVIVSVLVLKEGWDVKNVTTIVGLRAYTAKANILPEQTLGRGLRLMYPENPDMSEKVSVIGTPAFMEFVEGIQKEGVILEHVGMGDQFSHQASTLIEVDSENPRKDIEKLSFDIPLLSSRFFRQYENLTSLHPSQFKIQKYKIKKDKVREKREIHFKYMVSEKTDQPYSHTTILDENDSVDYRGYLGFLTQTLIKELKLINCYDIVYQKVKEFICEFLFEKPICLEDKEMLINISESGITPKIIEIFKQEINQLIVKEKDNVSLTVQTIQLMNTHPFRVKQKDFVTSQKSVFDKIVGDNGFENTFASFLESCDDIISYTKNYFAIGFKLDYLDKDGNMSYYYPDFLVKQSFKKYFVIETKGREDLNDPLKIKRLKQWCEDMNRQGLSSRWDFVFVDEEDFKKYNTRSFQELIDSFQKYKK